MRAWQTDGGRRLPLINRTVPGAVTDMSCGTGTIEKEAIALGRPASLGPPYKSDSHRPELAEPLSPPSPCETPRPNEATEMPKWRKQGPRLGGPAEAQGPSRGGKHSCQLTANLTRHHSGEASTWCSLRVYMSGDDSECKLPPQGLRSKKEGTGLSLSVGQHGRRRRIGNKNQAKAFCWTPQARHQ